jgi:hypothetical protein
MAAMRSSLLSRVAVQSMHWAVRVWPDSSRQWGMAVLGEMDEIAEPGAVLSWAAGGMLLFLRAVVAQVLEWMKLPAGSGFSGAALPSTGDGPQFPKHSRLATAVVLLAAVTLLFLPMGREAARTVDACWHGFVPSQRERQDLERLADRGTHFADEAVQLDPSLTWIYASRYSYRPSGEPTLTGERLKQLKSYDPDNAAVYLVSAFVEGEPLIENRSGRKGSAVGPLGDELAKNRQWLKDMDAAFHAPKYDNYFQPHQELAREGWSKAPALSPGAIAVSLWSHNIPDATQIQAYGELRVREALQAGSTGRAKDAEDTLAEVAGLGKRMSDAGATPYERMVGLGLMKRGLEGYEKLYRASGQTKEANEIAAQLHEAETTTRGHIDGYIGWREEIVKGLWWKAVLLQAAGILSLLLMIATACSLVVLEVGTAIGRRLVWLRTAMCKVVDYGPAVLVLTSLVFLWSFQPIARIFEQYRSGKSANMEMAGLFWQLFALRAVSLGWYFREPYYQWLLATILLVVIGAFLLVHGLLRAKGTAER